MIGKSRSQHSVTNKLVRNRMTRRRWIRTTSLMIGIILVVLSCDKKESSPTGSGNTAPELSNIGNQVVQAGQTSKIILTTRDEDGDALNFNIPTNPGFLSITSFSQEGDTATAILVMEPGESLSGNYNATVRVSDGKGGEDNEDFIIEVSAQPSGPEWTVFDKNNSEIPSDAINAIVIDSDGNKWIGTGGGLAKYDDTNWTVYNPNNSELPSTTVYSLCLDVDQNLWIGTHLGLAKFNGVSWTVYNEDNSGLSGNWVDALAIDVQGNVWTGSGLGDGVSKFDGVNWTVYKDENSDLPIDWINVIAVDVLGTVWIGTEGGGLVKIVGANWEVYNRFDSGMPSNIVNTITFDPLGNTWVGMESWWTGFNLIPGGLTKFDGTNWTVYSSGNSGLPVEDVSALAVDQAWNLWIGTWLGLARFDGANWTVYTAGNSGLPDSDITAVAIDANGNKWVGTDNGGLALFRGGQ